MKYSFKRDSSLFFILFCEMDLTRRQTEDGEEGESEEEEEERAKKRKDKENRN